MFIIRLKFEAGVYFASSKLGAQNFETDLKTKIKLKNQDHEQHPQQSNINWQFRKSS